MELLTTGQVATLLSVSHETVRRMIDNGTLPAIRLMDDDSGWFRIERNALEAYAARKGITLNWANLEK